MWRLVRMMNWLAIVVVFTAFTTFYNSARGATYDVDIDATNGAEIGDVSGTVTTDGRFGALSSADITSWDLEFSIGSFEASLQSNAGLPYRPLLTLSGSGLTGTPTDLYFDFS